MRPAYPYYRVQTRTADPYRRPSMMHSSGTHPAATPEGETRHATRSACRQRCHRPP